MDDFGRTKYYRKAVRKGPSRLSKAAKKDMAMFEQRKEEVQQLAEREEERPKANQTLNATAVYVNHKPYAGSAKSKPKKKPQDKKPE